MRVWQKKNAPFFRFVLFYCKLAIRFPQKYEYFMKKSTLLTAIFCLVLASPTCLLAQKLSKEEAKRLQAELKALAKSPEKLKAQKAESEEHSVTENVRNAQLIDMKAKLKKQENELAKADNDILTNKLALDKLSVALQTPPKNTGIGNLNKNATQTRALYRVQIGAYINPNIAQVMQTQENFEIETMDTGMKRYLVGKFVSYQEANRFTQKLRTVGAQAFMVGYLDGKRLGNLKEMPVEFMQK